MLCERCKKEETLVHLTLVTSQGDERRDLCESCYRASGIAKKIASAGSEVTPATRPGWSVHFLDFGKLRYKARKGRNKKKP